MALMNTQKSVSRFEERTLADFTAYFRASNVERPSRLNSVCDIWPRWGTVWYAVWTLLEQISTLIFYKTAPWHSPFNIMYTRCTTAYPYGNIIVNQGMWSSRAYSWNCKPNGKPHIHLASRQISKWWAGNIKFTARNNYFVKVCRSITAEQPPMQQI